MSFRHITDTVVGAPSPQDVEAAEAISNAINVMSVDGYRVGALCAHDHRTLQQKMMTFCVGFIRQAEELTANGRFDHRNQGTAELADRLVQALDNEPVALPLI